MVPGGKAVLNRAVENSHLRRQGFTELFEEIPWTVSQLLIRNHFLHYYKDGLICNDGQKFNMKSCKTQ